MSASRYLHGTATVDICPLNILRTPERSMEHSLIAVVKMKSWIINKKNMFLFDVSFVHTAPSLLFLCWALFDYVFLHRHLQTDYTLSSQFVFLLIYANNDHIPLCIVCDYFPPCMVLFWMYVWVKHLFLCLSVVPVLFMPICLSLIHIWRCRRGAECRSRWSPYH